MEYLFGFWGRIVEYSADYLGFCRFGGFEGWDYGELGQACFRDDYIVCGCEFSMTFLFG